MQNPAHAAIEKEIRGTPVVLYMKGTAAFPQCGFSATVVQALADLGAPFTAVNVLEDNTLRQAIKDFTGWPTLPQLYVAGEFIGGCDIVREMATTGELEALLRDKGIIGPR
ncbi:MAG: Grx4 family monothiol glutaredoxin [Alphaproteobacteria bacterium]|jgi:monothiol glutaredoxin|nr:Grx4 family monothiol glutaredoxin [Alphaproteobacteria bacterium]